MISVVLYGRNDAHGYNLHKRGALSLNCIAEVLSSPQDEIIFVDYNTPDDFPTFPEAIGDTLTDRAKARLRVLRVRPHHHARFRERTGLLALEPIARNVAIRHSQPDNRWILSTNTDMIFVPRRRASLSEIVSTLPDAYYHLPRFELPEPLWESLNRLDAAGAIERLESWGRAFHLNEIVTIRYPETKYDAPGDFQLILRSDLFRIHGFNESMLLGWHVDSNMGKRLSLLPRPMGELVDELFGYHCDHWRQMTAVHSQRGQHNDVVTFFEGVAEADVPEQAQTWGLAGETIEEITIGATGRSYLAGLASAIPAPMTQPTEFHYSARAGESYDYSVDHVLPFLAGAIASFSRKATLGWAGADPTLLRRFAALWKSMGFGEPILVLEEARWLGAGLPDDCQWASDEVLDERAHSFVFDFGRAPSSDNGVSARQAESKLAIVVNAFRRLARLELRRLERSSFAPRRFIAVNPILNSDVIQLFSERISSGLTPAGTHIREGFVVQSPIAGGASDEIDCMSLLIVGPAGALGPAPSGQGAAIHAKAGVSGILAYGPYITLTPGRYEASFELYSQRAGRGAALRVDVASGRGKRILAQRIIKPHARAERSMTFDQAPLTCILPFDVRDMVSEAGDEDLIECRVWAPGGLRFCLVSLRIRLFAAGATRQTALGLRGQTQAK